MRILDLERLVIKDSEEEIKFSNGSLYVYDDGFLKSWEVQLIDVENGDSFNSAMSDGRNLSLKFKTDNNVHLEGNVIVKNIKSSSLGIYIHLLGNGKLHGI